MENKKIHVVSFDIPFPANYGGVIDVFYKLKSLKDQGFQITLHCFQYKRKPAPELENFCDHVIYYKRNESLGSLFSILPFIVKSRMNKTLLHNLSQDSAPIIFEGLHTTGFLNHTSLKSRIRIFRESNIEHHYYYHLARSEKNFFKKAFFYLETIRLAWFEKILNSASVILTVSLEDQHYFKRKFALVPVVNIPSFHENKNITCPSGKGKYILYHGSLDVAENKKAAEFLISVFENFEYPFVIAGKNPDNELKNLCRKSNVELVENPDQQRMNDLIENAHINLLYTFQATGLKLKLLNVLFKGRFCLVNSKMLAGTELHPVCQLANSPEEIKENIRILWNKEFTSEEIEARRVLLTPFSNQINIKRLTELISDFTQKSR